MARHRTAAFAIVALAVVALQGCGENETHPDRMRFDAGTPAPFDCVPNLDGRIAADEMQAATGTMATFLINPSDTTRMVDVAGEVNDEGRRVWDWGTDFADDQLLSIEAGDVAERWYASEFPEGELYTSGVVPGRLETVMRQDDRALWLLGFASAEPDPPEGRTLLKYEEPVPLYRFPIEPGNEYAVSSRIMDGELRGLPFAGRDTYEVRVDAAGRLLLPDLTFDQAHRVRVKVTVEPAVGMSVTRRQVSMLFECFGEVARAVPPEGNTEEDFTTAAEWRRLSLEE